jgi:hypothetical protein
MNLKELTQKTITQNEKENANLKDFQAKLDLVLLPATYSGCYLSQGDTYFDINNAVREDFCAFKKAYPKVIWEHGISDPECLLWFTATNMDVGGLPIRFWAVKG